MDIKYSYTHLHGSLKLDPSEKILNTGSVKIGPMIKRFTTLESNLEVLLKHINLVLKENQRIIKIDLKEGPDRIIIQGIVERKFILPTKQKVAN
jgi:hypothetical protein